VWMERNWQRRVNSFAMGGHTYSGGRRLGFQTERSRKIGKNQRNPYKKKVKRGGRKKALDGGRRKKSCCVVLCRREGGEHVDVPFVCLEFLFVGCVRRVV
jgi:hypothetical protein